MNGKEFFYRAYEIRLINSLIKLDGNSIKSSISIFVFVRNSKSLSFALYPTTFSLNEKLSILIIDFFTIEKLPSLSLSLVGNWHPSIISIAFPVTFLMTRCFFLFSFFTEKHNGINIVLV